MRIEDGLDLNMNRDELSAELDFFFDNVMDTVVEFFIEEKDAVKV